VIVFFHPFHVYVSCHFVSIWLERGLVDGVSTKTCSFLANHFVLQLVVLYLLVLSLTY
jgi:hypothetical protein